MSLVADEKRLLSRSSLKGVEYFCQPRDLDEPTASSPIRCSWCSAEPISRRHTPTASPRAPERRAGWAGTDNADVGLDDLIVRERAGVDGRRYSSVAVPP